MLEIRGNYCKRLVEEGAGRGGKRVEGGVGWGGEGWGGMEQIKPFTIAALFTMFYAYKFGHRVCIGWSIEGVGEWEGGTGMLFY